MPKMKSHRGAAKRLAVTGSGKIMRRRAYRGHLSLAKTSRRLRRLAGEMPVAGTDLRQARRLLGR